METNKMDEKAKFIPKAPDFKGSGIDIWKAIDKNGKMFLKVKVLDGSTINCFKNEPKVKVETVDI